MAGADLTVGLLGPVALAVDGEPVELSGLRRRAILAVLAAARNGMPLDRLADAVWSDTGRPPARNTVQVHVHQLRQVLAPHGHALRHTATGYRLDVTEVDVRTVEDVLRRARAADRAGDVAGAAAGYRAALAGFRGEFCADLPELRHFEAARGLYQAVWLETREAALAAELRLGTPGLVPELEDLVARHPLRERLWGQLMVALYREGRQSDALGAYRRAREALAEEAGLDPGSALRHLEQEILRQARTTALLQVVAPGAEVSGRATLTWLDDSGVTRTRALQPRESLLIGRDAAADVALTWDGSVSRRHATLVVSTGTVTLTDLGSRNGTFLNSERLAPDEPGRPLRPGDLFRCGGTVLAVAGLPRPGPGPAATDDTATC